MILAAAFRMDWRRSSVELEPAGTVEDAVTVVDPVTDEAVREHENRFLRERIANRTQTTQLEKTGTTYSCEMWSLISSSL